MNLVKIFLLTCVMFKVFSINSQVYYNNLYDVSLGIGSMEKNENSIYLKGLGYNNSGSGTIIYSKYFINGQLVAVDTFSVDSVASYNGDFDLWHNQIVTFNATDTVLPYSGEHADCQISVLDTNFNTIWTSTFGGSNQEISIDVLTTDSAFYFLGTSNSWDNGNGDVFLRKTDTLGNLLWQTEFGTDKADYGRNISQLNDSLFLVSWTNEVTNTFAVTDYDLALSLINSDGIVLWEKYYGDYSLDYGGSFKLLNDNSILFHRNTSIDNVSVGYIEKINLNGEVVWSKQFSNGSYLAFDFVEPVENIDGTILVTCVTKNSSGTPIARVYLLDPFGNTIWFKNYFTRPDIAQYIYDIKPTDDGGYIMGGSAFAVGGNQQSAWLLKTNCNGEEGVQFPITPTACAEYECSLYPIHANFTASNTIVDLATTNGEVEFTNTSNNTTNRVWSFGDGAVDYTDEIITHTYQTAGIYQVQLITYHGPCSDTTTQTIEVINSLGVNDYTLGDKELLIYPNPNTGEFTVKLLEKSKINIYNSLGKLVYNAYLGINETQLNVSYLTAGFYTVVAISNSGITSVKRLIIQ